MVREDLNGIYLREQKDIAMTEAKAIDVIYGNGIFKSIEKVEPVEGVIMRACIKKVVDILMATSGKFKGAYDKAMRYGMYDFR